MFTSNTRFVPGLGTASELVQAAFKLTPKKPVSQTIFDVGGKLVVVRLKNRERPDPKKFAEEQSKIEEGLLFMRRRKFMQSYLGYLMEKASVTYNDQVYGQS